MRPNSKYQLSYTQKDRFKHDITVSLKNIYLLNSRKYHLATIFFAAAEASGNKNTLQDVVGEKAFGSQQQFR